MKTRTRLRPFAALAMAFLGLVAMRAEATSAANADVVIEWNQAVVANTPASVGLFSFRFQAMTHIAMFDAVNSIHGRYRPYHVRVHALPTASAEAAAAQAAHDVLVKLIPEATSTFDTLLNNRLATLPKSRAAQGAAVGKKVAASILAWRTADGFDEPNLSYLPPPLPGMWQPAAPGQVAAFVQYQNAEPFALLTPTQYLPTQPPALNTPEYAAAVEEVRALGSANSTVRTAEQTVFARAIAGIGYSPNPFGLWATATQGIVRSQDLSLLEAARVFAFVSVALTDGLQTSHSSKFIYNLWRPITAIQRANEDLNDLTTADPSWTPLLPTPPYPSHSSNVACLSASAARALARVFRTDAVPFTVTWTGTGGNADFTRSFARFSQLAEEAGLSRVHGGIHFTFELDASHEACTKVADFLFDNYMQRLW